MTIASLALAIIFFQGSATTTNGEVSSPSTDGEIFMGAETTTEEPAVELTTVEQYEACVGLMVDVLAELECSRHDLRIQIKTDSFEELCRCVEKAREKKMKDEEKEQ